MGRQRRLHGLGPDRANRSQGSTTTVVTDGSRSRARTSDGDPRGRPRGDPSDASPSAPSRSRSRCARRRGPPGLPKWRHAPPDDPDRDADPQRTRERAATVTQPPPAHRRRDRHLVSIPYFAGRPLQLIRSWNRPTRGTSFNPLLRGAATATRDQVLTVWRAGGVSIPYFAGRPLQQVHPEVGRASPSGFNPLLRGAATATAF